MSLGSRLLRSFIRLYQGFTAHRPSPCRYQPTCSHYAIGALEAHGAWRGSRLAVARILRCRPGAAWGFDPVPGTESTQRRETKRAQEARQAW